MAATLIEATAAIDVSNLSVLLYGPPGVGKTSVAQTAPNPLTLDLDRGAHRSAFRKSVMRFDSWADIAEAQAVIARHQTIVIDTVGRLLDLMTQDIVANNSRHGSPFAGLSLQGFGVLKARFAQWVGQLRLTGKDLIFIAHEKEEKEGDSRILRADITGSSYGEVMKFTDLVGYLSMRNRQRVLDFNPTDQYVGKNAAGWDAVTVPHLKESPRFMADLLADAKARIGKTAEASAALAAVVDKWEKWILSVADDLEKFNAGLADLSQLGNGAKKQAWHLCQGAAERNGWEWDKAAKLFKAKQGEAA